jgi:DNA-binding transcriptional MocR family regulator
VPLLLFGRSLSFRFFTGIFISEALVRSGLVSAGAKLAYGRLARYAGQGGMCFPAVGTLAREIGVGARQAQKYLAELERVKLIRRRTRFSGRAQTSNFIEFLWHPIFQDGVNDSSGEGVNDHSPGGVNNSSPKESHSEEGQSEETRDLDSPATNRKKRDSHPDAALASECRRYPRLREALAQYMNTETGGEKELPSARHVVDVMDAASR